MGTGGGGLRGEISNRRLAATPIHPSGCGETGFVASVRALDDAGIAGVGDALTRTPSRSKQLLADFRLGTLKEAAGPKVAGFLGGYLRRVNFPAPRCLTSTLHLSAAARKTLVCYPSRVLQMQGKVTEHLRRADYSILHVEASPIANAASPGQFVMAAPHVGDSLPTPLLKRALAIYQVSSPADGPAEMTLLLKVVGEGTRRLSLVRPGEELDLVGPLGVGFDLARAAGRINLIVAGGTGIASVYLLAERLVRSGEEVRLIYGGRTREDLVGLDDFHRLQVEVIPATEDGSLGHPGLVTGALGACLSELPARLVNLYACGPNRMMQVVTELALPLGIPCQVSVEMKMACGFGVCLGCTVKTRTGYRLACTHGPVFDAEGFVWEPSPSAEVIR
jgi:dihydroorotate dehydrogenase electron transfer subunit